MSQFFLQKPSLLTAIRQSLLYSSPPPSVIALVVRRCWCTCSLLFHAYAVQTVSSRCNLCVAMFCVSRPEVLHFCPLEEMLATSMICAMSQQVLVMFGIAHFWLPFMIAGCQTCIACHAAYSYSTTTLHVPSVLSIARLVHDVVHAAIFFYFELCIRYCS